MPVTDRHPPEKGYTMRIDYKYEDQVCTVIYVDFTHQRIAIQNHTDDILDRAFGIIEEPTWQDFEQFLASRCFPESRGYAKDILRGLDLDSYDPLAIAEATGGRTAEDHMNMAFRYYPKEEAGHEVR